MSVRSVVTRIGLPLVLVVAAYFAFIRVCSYGGGMAAAYTECKCRGFEWLLYDHTPADGPRKSLCIGIVVSRRCLQFMGGPEVDCSKRRTSRLPR